MTQQPLFQIMMAVVLVLVTAFTPAVATAQSASEPQSGGQLFDQEHRERIYESRKLSYGEATAWSLALPGLGNFYAEQYLLGALALISMVFAGFFVGYGLDTGQSDLTWTGVGLAGVTYGWSLGTALWGVSVYNDELRQNLHLDRKNQASQTGLSLSIRW